jgi:hypothetical protein
MKRDYHTALINACLPLRLAKYDAQGENKMATPRKRTWTVAARELRVTGLTTSIDGTGNSLSLSLYT